MLTDACLDFSILLQPFQLEGVSKLLTGTVSIPDKSKRYSQWSPPNPVELGASGATQEEVDSEQVPVLWDDDQRISGPDQAWSTRAKVMYT